MDNTSATSSGLATMLHSGVEPIDLEWGGLYRGGAYLVFGRAASGRGTLTLRYTLAGVQENQRSMFIASARPKDLMIQAASIGFDLKQAQKAGLVRMMRIPPMLNPQGMGDDAVAKALWDLVTILRNEQPDRLVINDFMPFVMFRSFDRFRMEFVRFLEQIDSLETTVLLALPEPANQQSRRVIEFMSSQMTGSVHIEMPEDDPSTTRRRITLIPHIGQIRRQVVGEWDLESVVRPPESMSGMSSVITESFGEVDEEAPVEAAAPAATAPPPPVAPPPVAPTPTPEPTPSVEDRFTDRIQFRNRLQRMFIDRDDENIPFLLLALRMDREADKASRPFDFDFIIDLVADTLRPDDDMLISPANERLVVLLADSKPEEAQGFFARLKNRLRADAPQQADHLLHAVSAIVVPDGRPFQSAEEFLSYALDEA